MDLRLSRRAALIGFAAVAGCVRKPDDAPASEPGSGADAAPDGSLAWAIAGDWRSVADRARDPWTHPLQTLQFFEMEPGQTVIDMWPGVGYWTEILAPFLSRSAGTYIAAQIPGPAAKRLNDRFLKRFVQNPARYGKVVTTEFGASSAVLAPPASADRIMFMRVIHDWMAAGIAEKGFRDAFAALKPGGILGIEQHRGDVGEAQDAVAKTGYVQEPFVKALAAEAGFQFIEASEINANPADTKDHPFDVWTLPPDRLSAPPGKPADPNFDHGRYDAIGESDRMTLKFRKPS